MNFSTLSLKVKLIAGFFVVSVFVGLVGFIGLRGLGVTGKNFDLVLDEEVPIADASMEAILSVVSGRDMMGEFLLTEDKSMHKELEGEFSVAMKDFDEQAEFLASHGTAQMKSMIGQAQNLHEKFEENAFELMRGGRARWKIENETFNTLKNQGYHFEHNYGHGQANLSVVFVLLMMLAFLVDQVLQLTCRLFQAVWRKEESKARMWEHVRALFYSLEFPSMVDILKALLYGYRVERVVILE